jgi:hypothetical protein
MTVTRRAINTQGEDSEAHDLDRHVGNAHADGMATRGWFVGDFIPTGSRRCPIDVGVRDQVVRLPRGRPPNHTRLHLERHHTGDPRIRSAPPHL